MNQKKNPNKFDPWVILDVTKEDAEDAKLLRKAYKKLSLLQHPDKNKEAGAEDVFKQIQSA